MSSEIKISKNFNIGYLNDYLSKEDNFSNKKDANLSLIIETGCLTENSLDRVGILGEVLFINLNKYLIKAFVDCPLSDKYATFFYGEGSQQTFFENLKMLLLFNPKMTAVVNYKIDLVSIFECQTFLAEILKLNRETKNSYRTNAATVNFKKSDEPEWLSVDVANESTADQILILQQFVEINIESETLDGVGFFSENLVALKSFYNSASSVNSEEKIKLQSLFNSSLLEKQTKDSMLFIECFPHLRDFWEHCTQFDPLIISKTLQLAKTRLDEVSPSFCLAKWTTATLHLESGTTHSCHHPAVHLIPKEEIQNNPNALHNTQYKIAQRKKMIEGVRPKECDYCWNIEDLKTNELSDRIIKSAAPYSLNQFQDIVNNPYSNKINPRYIEISFSNKCQFKCSYCSADYSSTWQDELDKYGNYQTMSGARTKEIIPEDENTYVQTFWKWWPNLKKDIHTLRVTGGEPLLSPSTFKLMEGLSLEKAPSLSLSINSNLGAPKVLIDKFVNMCKEIERNKSVKKLDVYTSIDAYAERAEYIRNGLKHEQFWHNLEHLLSETTELKVYIMCTFNCLSLTSFVDLLKKVREVNIKYRNNKRVFPLDIDFAYLRHPEYQSVRVLPENYQNYMQQIIEHIEENQWLKTPEKIGFLDYHLIKIKRILEWMRQPISEEELKVQRSRFYQFFSQHDLRRGTNFLETFPEMEDFWNLCKNEFEKNSNLKQNL